jgi:hypothetical protein
VRRKKRKKKELSWFVWRHSTELWKKDRPAESIGYRAGEREEKKGEEKL